MRICTRPRKLTEKFECNKHINQKVNDSVIKLYISSIHSITLRCAGMLILFREFMNNEQRVLVLQM